MKIISSKPKQGLLTVRIETLTDIWYLSQVIEPGDTVRGKTERKVLVGNKEEKHQVKRVYISLAIEVERVEFHKYSDVLRVSGKISDGPGDIPRAQYHTISIVPNMVITIIKPVWLDYQLQYIREARVPHPQFLLLVMDRDEATFALLEEQGYRVLSKITGDMEKKLLTEKRASKFYSEIIGKLEEYFKRYSVKRIILASPAFWKEDLLREIKNPDLKQRIIQATCNHAGEQGIVEVLKREELRTALKEDRVSKELVLVERLLKEISVDGKAAYGAVETKQAAEHGAVETLLVTDGLIQKTRQQGTYPELASVMKQVQHSRGKIEVIASENPGGKRLDGLGGIAGILRYKA